MVNGNLAYKHDVVTRPIKPNRNNQSSNRVNTYPQRNRSVNYSVGNAYLSNRQQSLNKPVHTTQKVNTFEKDKREMVHRKVTLLRIAYMSVIALSATFMISKFVAVNETAGEIRSLTKELESTRAYTSQRVFEMERSIDLSEVEKIATTELGMQRPESYQIVYVNVDKDDVSEVTADDVEGAGNEVKSFLTTLKKNIIELFSIK